MSTELRKQRELVARRVKGLSLAIRLDKFRLAQHLRMGLAASLQHLEGPLRMTLYCYSTSLAFGCATLARATKPSGKSNEQSGGSSHDFMAARVQSETFRG